MCTKCSFDSKNLSDSQLGEKVEKSGNFFGRDQLVKMILSISLSISMAFIFIDNYFSFTDLSEQLRQFNRNRQESPVSSTFNFTRSLMDSIYSSEKCELSDSKKGNASSKGFK